jgi:hypothetical protein
MCTSADIAGHHLSDVKACTLNNEFDYFIILLVILQSCTLAICWNTCENIALCEHGELGL